MNICKNLVYDFFIFLLAIKVNAIQFATTKNNSKTKNINIMPKIYGKGSILLTKSKTLVSKRLAVYLGESEDMYLFSLLLCRA